MSAPDLSLLAKKRFGPMFAVQFLGAFNDNLLKFAMLFMASFGVAEAERAHAGILATVATGLFILPYFLFSGIAGRMADAMDKARLVRLVKLAEIAIMGIACVGFWTSSTSLLLFSLFLMGCHSTLFGPVKFAILPQLLGPRELVGGTGMVEAGTFVAILGGQLLGGALDPHQASIAVLIVAVLGWLVSLAVPAAPPSSTVLIDWNPIRTTRDALRAARDGRGVWLSILGISWFFAIGAVLLSEFAPLVSGVIGGGRGVVTLFLLVFSIGVALGSVLVGRVLKGEVSARTVPAAALVMSFFMIDLWLATSGWDAPTATVGAMLSTLGGWRLMVDLAAIAVSGGFFIVPLYAILQKHSPESERARTIAANNVVNAGVTVLVVGVVTAMLARGESVPGIIGFMGFSTLAVALISCWLLPETVFKSLVRGVLRLLYRVEVMGAENMPGANQPSVVVVNHVSFLDGVLIGAFMPGRPTFAIATKYANAWWMKPALMLFDAFPVDPANPMSAKAMVKAVRDEGRTLVIFPEGRITVTGALMKVFDGPGMVAAKADAPVVPIRIDGAQYTPFSRLKGKVRQRWFPKIRITALEPRRFNIMEEGSARERRRAAGCELYDRMSDMVFQTTGEDATLFEALISAADIHGGKAKILEDVKRQPLSYSRLITGSFALGRKLDLIAAQEEGKLSADGSRTRTVGLLLPNVNAAVVSFFGLQAFGRVPAMLNFTAGLNAMRSACRTARIQVVVTSRAFVEQTKMQETIVGIEDAGVRIVYLEDVAPTVTKLDKVRALIETRFASSIAARRRIEPSSPAVILFTSGSEGLPKGVVLSHRNLLSNARQLAARIDFNSSDVVLNALPIFHSFGLGGGTLLPLLNGVKVFLYPSPLHYRIVPAVAYDCNATILFGTGTFLSGYARMANPYDFYSVRYIFAGAEKVKPELRKVYAEKFGLRILEGYGTTETSPVIAVNTPMHFKADSVGRLLPGMDVRYEKVPGIEKGARMFVRGPNVMLGYYLDADPGVLVAPEGGWHDTGDVTSMDGDGFITIEARAKRFCKIGGEMVSMPAVELDAEKVWPQAESACSKRLDAKKGEALVLYTTQKGALASEFSAWARANGVAEIAVPKDVRIVEKLPVLGTGKTDYVTLDAMASGEDGRSAA